MGKITEAFKKVIHGSERKRREFVVSAQNYTADHPNEFLIIGDLATDVMVVAYKDLIVPVHFHKNGKRTNTLRNALDYRKTNNSVDTFLLSLDGAIASIATTLYNRKHGTKHSLPLGAQDDAMPEPDIPKDIPSGDSVAPGEVVN